MSRDVHVWRFSLDPPEATAHRLAVRSTLSRYLGADPRSLVFAYGTYGKPRLVSPPGRLDFSSARSGDIGVLAVARRRDVGVDVERIEPRRALGPIADQLFAADEAAELRALQEESRILRFFELWTQKEAYAKAFGTGLSLPLSRLRAPAGWSLHQLQLGPGFAGALCVRGTGLRIRMHG
jgi:4'-phosphopantetheinyl transferase